MTQKLPITITQEGLQALIDADAGTTSSVRFAELGLSSTPFIMAPTLTALPGEFKRLSTIAGEAVSDSVLHMVATDDDVESYTVTGVGIFLDNGDLFGTFSQGAGDGPLFEKSEAATFLFAVDITFADGQAALIEFGDANFTYPPATETRKGVGYLATAAEVAAGVDPEKFVTPATLAGAFIPVTQKGVANGVATLDASGKVPPSQLPAVDSIDTFTVASQAEMLALPAGPGDFARRTDENKTYVLRQAPASTLGNWAEFLSPGAPVRSVNGEIGDVVIDAADVGAPPIARSIGVTGGLLTGGGSLAADRTIGLLIATAAEALAGVLNDRALTPASLAQVLTSIAGKVGTARNINTAGLATGGGNLSADRTITVPKASAADLEAGSDDTKALTTAALWGTLRSIGPTGYLRIPGSPVVLQWGSGTHNVSHASKVNNFPVAFPGSCWHVFAMPYGDPDTNDESDEHFFVSARTQTSFTSTTGGDNASFPFGFIAIGN